MQIYKVEPRGALYRVVDYEGHPIGTSFLLKATAQSYADALNEAHRRHRVLPAVGATSVNAAELAARHQLGLRPPTRATVRQRLRNLVAKINSYRQVRIGL